MVLDARDLQVELQKPNKRIEYRQSLEEAGEDWVEYARGILQDIEKSHCGLPILGEHPNVEEFVAAIIDFREFYGDDTDATIQNCAKVFRSVSIDSQIGLMSQVACEYANRDRTDVAISIVDSTNSKNISSMMQLSPEFSFHRARIYLGIAESFARQGDETSALAHVWHATVARDSCPDARLDTILNKVIRTINMIPKRINDDQQSQ